MERRPLRPLDLLVFGCVPVLLVALFTAVPSHATYAWDFHAFWGAAAHVVHGRSPYASLGANSAGTPYPAYLYPPLLAELIVPLGALPFMTAAIVFTAASIAALAAALALLGVRDWRCYGAAFLWLPVLHGLRLGTLTPFLVLAVAAAWHLRERRAGAVFAPAVATLKLFLWPLLVATRDRAGALRAIGLALLLTLGSWALVGFAGLTSYPRLLQSSQGVWEANGYGVAALAGRIGFPTGVVNAGLLVAAVAALAILHRRRLDARGRMSAAIVVALLVSPVEWLHYSMLLLVPVALYRPRLGAAWLAPLVLWLTPVEEADGAVWRIALFLVVVVATPLLAQDKTIELPSSREIVPG